MKNKLEFFAGVNHETKIYTLLSNLNPSNYPTIEIQRIKNYHFIFYSPVSSKLPGFLNSRKDYMSSKHFVFVAHFGKLNFSKIETDFIGKIFLEKEF